MVVPDSVDAVRGVITDADADAEVATRTDRIGSSASSSSSLTALVLGFATGLCCLLVWLRLRDTYVFADDDFVQFEVARRSGLGWELLTLNVFSHFGPVNRLGHLLLLHTELDVTVGAAVSTALVGIVLLSTIWLVSELGMSLVRRLLVVVATGASLGLTDVAHWTDAAWHILPVLAFTNAVVAMHVRGLRTGRSLWLWAAAAVFPFGLLIQERAAFALPIVVLVDVLLVWNPAPVRERLRRLWSIRRPLLAMTVTAAAGAVLIQRFYAGTGTGPPLGVVARTMVMALTYQFPQLTGYQPVSPPTPAMQLATMVLGLVLAVGVVLVNRANLGPALFIVAVFGLYWGFLVFSPILNAWNVAGTAARLSNSAYLTLPIFIGLASMHGPARWSTALDRLRSAHPRRWLVAGCVAALLVVTIVDANARQVIQRDWAADRAANDFFAGARASAERWTDPALTVLPLHAPERVTASGPWVEAYGEESFLLPLMAPGWALTELTDRTVILDDRGEVQPVTLATVSAADRPAGDQVSCNSPTTDTDGVQLAVSPPATATPLFAVVHYRSDSDGLIRSIAFDGDRFRFGAWKQPILAGSHRTVVPLPSGTVDAVRLFGMPAGSTFCVESLTVVTPVAVNPDGTCQQIDYYGRPQLAVSCPDRG
ncbi:hypothetical protein [Nakamurella sp.]|uniref:hypothetical protein n=1 Tax=Nakamurella sp. TaxID=1869182 RepID=UPI003783EF7B